METTTLKLDVSQKFCLSLFASDIACFLAANWSRSSLIALSLRSPICMMNRNNQLIVHEIAIWQRK